MDAMVLCVKVNNVEVVELMNTPPGTVTLTVSAANVPMDPQRYALVVNHNLGEYLNCGHCEGSTLKHPSVQRSCNTLPSNVHAPFHPMFMRWKGA